MFANIWGARKQPSPIIGLDLSVHNDRDDNEQESLDQRGSKEKNFPSTKPFLFFLSSVSFHDGALQKLLVSFGREEKEKTFLLFIYSPAPGSPRRLKGIANWQTSVLYHVIIDPYKWTMTCPKYWSTICLNPAGNN